jgi:hypothetical protein
VYSEKVKYGQIRAYDNHFLGKIFTTNAESITGYGSSKKDYIPLGAERVSVNGGVPAGALFCLPLEQLKQSDHPGLIQLLDIVSELCMQTFQAFGQDCPVLLNSELFSNIIAYYNLR